ncbi:hypothetical protein AGMMS49592_6140 [Endomicrobiia bacterium]|nr:hypothetical protein AGMMS49592_6140 [Endomicrobiia bacterium]
MIKVKSLDKHKRVRNMLVVVVLAMFICTNICLGVSDIKVESVSQKKQLISSKSQQNKEMPRLNMTWVKYIAKGKE